MSFYLANTNVYIQNDFAMICGTLVVYFEVCAVGSFAAEVFIRHFQDIYPCISEYIGHWAGLGCELGIILCWYR